MAGEYSLSVAISNRELQTSPLSFAVTAGVAGGSRSQLIPPPMPVLTHAPCEFLVQACDRYGNRISSGGNIVAARTNGPGAVQCVDADNSDGTYSVTLVASCSGEYRVIVSLDGHQVLGSPHGLSVVHAGASEVQQRAERLAQSQAARRLVHSGGGAATTPPPGPPPPPSGGAPTRVPVSYTHLTLPTKRIV